MFPFEDLSILFLSHIEADFQEEEDEEGDELTKEPLPLLSCFLFMSLILPFVSTEVDLLPPFTVA